MTTMNITTTVRDRSTFVEIEGQVDSHAAAELEQVLLGELAAGHRHLVIDFSLVSFISSMALRALLVVQREALKHGGGVRLFAVAPRVVRVLEIAGFVGILPIYQTYEEAIEDW